MNSVSNGRTSRTADRPTGWDEAATPAALLNAARAAHAHGLCVIPAATTGEKKPWPDGPSWKRYQVERPAPVQIDAWFSGGRYDGLGIVCGAISGNVEMFEFEGRAVKEGVLRELADIAEASGLGDLWRRVFDGYREVTPSGGIHLVYRVEGVVAGNVKLARRPATVDELAENPDEKIKVLVETRGEGGFVVVAPSGGRTHDSGAPWVLQSGGFDTIPTITPEERDALHHLGGAMDQMPTPELIPSIPHPRTYGGQQGGARPGDDFNSRASWDDILSPRGWEKVYASGSTVYWKRPGKRMGISATTGRNAADNLYVFSTSTEFEAEKPYDKFGAYALLNCGGSIPVAAKELLSLGYGRRPESLPHPVPQPGRIPEAENIPYPTEEPDDGEWTQGPVRRRGVLPEEFWERPVLRHIRQAAHFRNRSGDLVFGGVLARLSSMLPYSMTADTGVGSPACLNMLVGLLGPSGSGKSSAAWIPRILLPAPAELPFLDDLPLGSGQGIAEAFMGEIEEISETGAVYSSGPNKGKPKLTVKTKRGQVRHNVLFYVDEGESLTKQLDSKGTSIVGDTLRRAWVGAPLGQFNGQQVNTRVVPEGTYSLGMMVGFQEVTARVLLADHGTGTPQRFLWVSATDPGIPDECVPNPGPLSLKILRGTYRGGPVTFDSAIMQEIRRDDTASARGEIKYAPLDSHRPLMLVKVAVLLAILEDRVHVTAEDWRLAKIVWETSCELRDALVEQGRREEAEEEERRTEAHVRREVRAHAAISAVGDDIKRVARLILKYLNSSGGPMTRGALNKKIAQRDRKYKDAALNFAEARGWVAIEGDEITLGDSMPMAEG